MTGTLDVGLGSASPSLMLPRRRLALAPCFSLTLFIAAAVALQGQSTSFVIVTPDKATILVGDSQVFRLVDQDGKMQHNVRWTVSDPVALDTTDGDELTITAKSRGDFRITARSSAGSAEATVKVMEGDNLPLGTTKWSAGTIPGCKTIKLVPAVPSPSGADIFEESLCQDGRYVSAYTAEGIQLWRHKMTGAPEPVAGGTTKSSPAHLQSSFSSVCDEIAVGSDQRKIRELLSQRTLTFSPGPSGQRLWTVEQENVTCKLWFDEKGVVAKKQKAFVSE